jgi:hypothetical protein
MDTTKQPSTSSKYPANATLLTFSMLLERENRFLPTVRAWSNRSLMGDLGAKEGDGGAFIKLRESGEEGGLINEAAGARLSVSVSTNERRCAFFVGSGTLSTGGVESGEELVEEREAIGKLKNICIGLE